MGIYDEAIPEVVDFWVGTISEVLKEEFGIDTDPDQIKAQFKAAVEAGAIEAFIAQYGEEEAIAQGHKRYLAEKRKA